MLVVRRGCWASCPQLVAMDEEVCSFSPVEKLEAWTGYQQRATGKEHWPSPLMSGPSRFNSLIPSSSLSLTPSASHDVIRHTILQQLQGSILREETFSDNNNFSLELEMTSGSELRTEAFNLSSERDSFFQKASEAFRSGPYGPATAAFYSEQGHILNERIRSLHQRAAACILYSNNNCLKKYNSNEILIDFHGLHVDEVQILTRKLLTFWFDEKLWLRNLILVIVTGSGRHSMTSCRLFPAVLALIKEKIPVQWQWSGRHNAAIAIYGPFQSRG